MTIKKKAYVVGTCDTKEKDLTYVKELIVKSNSDLEVRI